MRIQWAILTLLCLPWVAFAGRRATAVATVSAGKVTVVTLTDAGEGYTNAPVVTFTGGGGTGAAATSALTGNHIGQITVTAGGTGYTNAPTVTIGSPPNSAKLAIELVPKLSLTGEAGTTQIIQWTESLATNATWTTLTNVVLGTAASVTVDLAAGSAKRYYRTVEGTNVVATGGFVWIAPGTFIMGSPTTEAGRDKDEVQHSVTLSVGFWMSSRETSQADFARVMGHNPSGVKGDTLPVQGVSWDEATEYCVKLTELEREAGRLPTTQEYRLPTEAEWEFAARAGSTNAFSFGDDVAQLGNYAWTSGNAGGQIHAGGTKLPNAFGLFDLHGNVLEWCSDWYDVYSASAVTNPTGPSAGTLRVIRGGGWDLGASFARSARRIGLDPDRNHQNLGFRPLLGTVR